VIRLSERSAVIIAQRVRWEPSVASPILGTLTVIARRADGRDTRFGRDVFRMSRDIGRSLLFVPGNRPRMIERAQKCGADAIVIDLEDAVPPADKRAARKVARAGVAECAKIDHPVYVRVNDVRSALTRGDLTEIVRPGLTGVVLPKTGKPQDLRDLDVLLREAETRNKVRPGDVSVIPLLETPAAILDCARIATAIDRITAISLGGEDYTASLGVPRTTAALAYARGVLVTVASAMGLAAVDTPFPNIKDIAGLREESQLAARIGFRGKYVIHPDQVPVVNEVLMPSEQEIAAARKIVRAAGTLDKGATAVDGQMVDAPILARAKAILQRAST
jgi:citrate lyase subunit beta/citryl-CoA lyase